MNRKTDQERIREFNDRNAPFYIVDLGNDNYSLCLPHDLLSEEYADYGQAAFDAYAEELGEPSRDKNGFPAYGNGYEWEAAFQKAFENDPNLTKISFDSECGGFFCDCGELSVLEDLGRRFKELCEDAERFTPIVSAGIREAEARQAEENWLMRTVRGYLMKYPAATFEIRTPDGDIEISPETGRVLLDGSLMCIGKGDKAHFAEDILNQQVCAVQRDLFDQDRFQMKTEIEQEENPTREMTLK